MGWSTEAAKLPRSGAQFGPAPMERRCIRLADCVRLLQMTGHGSKLGRKKEQAIAALLTQRNLDEAARAIGVAPNTLLKWMKLPKFQAALRDAGRAVYSQSVARLEPGASAAATTMLKTMIDPNAPASTRLRAAECVLNHATKDIEIEDIEARVAALEAVTATGEQWR